MNAKSLIALGFAALGLATACRISKPYAEEVQGTLQPTNCLTVDGPTREQLTDALTGHPSVNLGQELIINPVDSAVGGIDPTQLLFVTGFDTTTRITRNTLNEHGCFGDKKISLPTCESVRDFYQALSNEDKEIIKNGKIVYVYFDSATSPLKDLIKIYQLDKKGNTAKIYVIDEYLYMQIADRNKYDILAADSQFSNLGIGNSYEEYLMTNNSGRLYLPRVQQAYELAKLGIIYMPYFNHYDDFASTYVKTTFDLYKKQKPNGYPEDYYVMMNDLSKTDNKNTTETQDARHFYFKMFGENTDGSNDLQYELEELQKKQIGENLIKRNALLEKHQRAKETCTIMSPDLESELDTKIKEISEIVRLLTEMQAIDYRAIEPNRDSPEAEPQADCLTISGGTLHAEDNCEGRGNILVYNLNGSTALSNDENFNNGFNITQYLKNKGVQNGTYAVTITIGTNSASSIVILN